MFPSNSTRIRRASFPDSFGPGDEKRLRGIIERIRALDRAEVAELVSGLRRSFQKRHPDLAMIAKSNYDAVKYLITDER